MDTRKLNDALLELQSQRNVLDGAIANIEKALAMLSGSGEVSTSRPGKTKASDKGSYISDAVGVLESVGHPLHINELAARISKIRGAEIARPSLESSLGRHISKVENSRITKVKPSTYGLPAWKNQTVTLALHDTQAVA